MFADVRAQLGFRAAGADDQDRASRRHFREHAVQIFLVDRHVAAVDRVRLVVEILVRVAVVDDDRVGVFGIEMEHLCFAMIDPDHRVKVGG